MTKRKSLPLLASAALFVGVSTACLGQATHPGEAALTYQWVHTNAQPGDCGCFGLNGGGISAAVHVAPRFAAAAEVSAGYQGHGSSTGNTLTLVSFLVGPRYILRRPKPSAHHRLEPFAQVLLGGAHAGGGIAGAGDGTYAFAMRAGGGLDLALGRRVSLRLLQADYYLTDFANTVNDHQNNALLGSGVVFRWSH